MSAVTDNTVAAFVERTTAASGVPVRVDDPAVIEQVASIMRADAETRRKARAS